jgi:hypothetical protein
LKEGWWNDMRNTNTEYLRSRYGKLLFALVTLQEQKYAGCRTVVTQFRDFWRSLPQLEDRSGLNQMSQQCDQILKALPQ